MLIRQIGEQERATILVGAIQPLVEADDANGLGRVLAAAAAMRDAECQADVMRKMVQAVAQTQGVHRASAMVEAIEDARCRAAALSEISRTLTQAGQMEQALQALCAAFTASRLVGRESVFDVLRAGAITLGALDQGQTLRQIYEAVIGVEDWWGQ